MTKPAAFKTIPVTLIISVYKDTENLSCILEALSLQTHTVDEIIVSEDGQDPNMSEFISQKKSVWPEIVHLSQEDNGFRKNCALNKAISTSKNELLIFIDGDCVPHKEFISAHAKNCQPGLVSVGRRAEPGPFFSALIKKNKWFLRAIQNKWFYLSLLIPMTLDKGKNIEAGFYSPFLHTKNVNKEIGLLGCNFALYKQDILKINGFNEDYIYPGIGEDSDIEWRLNQLGIKSINIKFIATEYHLYHKSKYIPSQKNLNIFKTTRDNHIVFCKNGIHKDS